MEFNHDNNNILQNNSKDMMNVLKTWMSQSENNLSPPQKIVPVKNSKLIKFNWYEKATIYGRKNPDYSERT